MAADDPPPGGYFSDAKAGKREGMEASEAGADADWKATMIEIGISVAKHMQRFTTDELFEVYYDMDFRPTTHDNRAMGPVMRHLAKHHVCIKSTMWKESRRFSRHSAPLQVWTSLIYDPRA